MPEDIETGFTERANFGPADAATFPSGAHVAEVEIDIETGEVRLARYCAVDDVGTMLNPLLCEGQIHGGIVQGVGQALLENLVYDPASGQLLTGSFQDYGMPRADDFCPFELEENSSPTDKNPLGVKGAGEGGTIPAPAAIIGAIEDALSPFGVRFSVMPLTPDRIVEELRAAGAYDKPAHSPLRSSLP